MSKFYPDVTSEDGIEAGSNWGAMAAIGLGFLALLSAVPSFYTVGRLAGVEGAGPLVIVSAVVLMIAVLQAIFCFFAAWRFMQRKGAVIGILLAILIVLDFLLKFAQVAFTTVPIWQLAIMALYLPMLHGLYHGIRAARGARRRGALVDKDLDEVFG